MANEVKLTLKVDDNGSLAIVAKEAKSAAGATDKLNQSQEKLNRTRGNYNKLEKGVGQAGLSTAKGFSKQAQSISGGLVPAYAVLAANVFAITAAFNALQRVAALDTLRQGLVETGAAAGQNLPFVANQLREITDAAISTEQAMRATALAMSAGFNTAQLGELTKVAQGAAKALGRDLGDALDRLVRGTAKVEPEILDELGIIVRLDEAVENYALSINKSVSSLTQFERSQAFLNATIEQGKKKFDDLNESVEENSFNKLAASFSNLSDNILKFIANGLEPLVSFLASTPTALFGSLGIFASGLINSILPSLQEVSAKQAGLANEAMAKSRKAGKVISDNYLKSSKAINSLEYRPPSVQKLAGDFNAGTVSSQKLTKAISVTTGQISRKKGMIEALKAENKKSNAERIAQLEAEKAKIEDTKRALEGLKNTEEKRTGLSGEGKNLRQKGRMSRRESASLQAMEGSSLLGAFGIAGRSSKKQVEEIGKANGVIAKVGATVKATTSSFKLFGTAILRMIPAIGLAITAFGILQGVYNKLFPESQTEKTFRDTEEAFSNFEKVVFKLETRLEKTKDAFDRFAAGIKSEAGVFTAIADRTNAAIEAAKAQGTEELDAQIEKIVRIKESLKEAEEAGGSIMIPNLLGGAPIVRTTEDIRAGLERAKAEYKSMEEAFDQTVADEGIKTLEFAIARLEASGGDLTILAKLNAELENLKKAKSGEELSNQLGEIGRETVVANKALEGLPDTLAAYEKQQRKLTEKEETPFSRLAASAATLATELQAIPTEAIDSATEKSEKMGKTIQEAERLQTILNGATVEYVTQIKDSEGKVVGTYNKYAKVFATVEKVIRDTEKAQKEFQEESKRAAKTAKDLSKFSKDNLFIKKAEQSEQRKSTQFAIDALEQEELRVSLQKDSEERTKRLNEITQELKTLGEQLVDTEESKAQLMITQVREAQRLANLTSKALKMEQQMEQAVLKIAQARAKMAGASSGSEVSAAEQVRIFNEGAEKRKELEESTFRAELQNINLQYALLDAQMALEKVKMENILAESSLSGPQQAAIRQTFEQGQTAIAGAEKAALKLAGAKVGLDIDDTTLAGLPRIKGSKIIDFSGFETTGMFSATDAEGAQLDRKKVEESRSKTLDAISRKIEKNTVLGNTELAIAAKQEKIDKQRQFITADIAAINKGDMDPAEKLIQKAIKQGELDKLRTEELSLQRESIDNIVGRIENMGGGGVSVMGAFVGEMAKLAQPGAAFSAEFVGSFSERIAALAESFNPLFDQLRKLGPGGEVAAAIGQGMLAITESVTLALESYNKKTDEIGKKLSTTTTDYDASFKDMNFEQKAQTVAAGLGVAAMGMAQVNSMLAASASRAIGAIDGQIKAEQKRDGKSRASLEKIKQLEKKKDAMARKEFERNKKMQMAQVAISTASAAIAAYAPPPAGSGPLLGGFLSAAIVALGAMQMAAIASTSYQGGGGSPSAGSGPARALSMGKRSNVVDVSQRASGGELAYLRGQRGSGTNANDFTPAFYGSKKMRAAGGSVAGYTVGEQGPELFVPSVPGQIVPNDDVGSAQPINVNFNVQAIDSSSFNDALTVQRGNIISIIREAANGSGEGFLETVDVESLKMER